MTDFKTFQADSYSFARMLGKSIDVSQKAAYPANFHHIRTTEGLFILLNAHYHYLSFAVEVSFGTIRFVNAVEWAALFEEAGYRVCTSAELEQPLRDVQFEDGEKDLWKHWRPSHIGDVIYNFWD
ncbi:hypothetical protein MKY41_04710 [Sporosarcina sp. FSL W7-1349]|uniref:hypothetical protein n=1 Tax=Bacillales TaxID=1385 RepID=UPI000581DBA7|nr:hypothetical protein [Bacillus sp. OxB-1]BAQ10928.1 hypothetical protein OXB_2457 [Bacillus sp. OxB-1]